MPDLSQFSGLSSAAAGLVGAGGGCLGAVWMARWLFTRMIRGFDEKHREHAANLEKLTDKLAVALAKLAVLEALLQDLRDGRSQTEAKVATLALSLHSLNEDVWVCHRRIEMIAKGDQNVSKIQRRR